MMKKVFLFSIIMGVLFFVPTTFAKRYSTQLFLKLPKSKVNTPDGLAVDSSGGVLITAPNFNNAVLLKDKKIHRALKPRIMKFANGRTKVWYTFKKRDLSKFTHNIGPMGIAFGPDGNLYIADNQFFFSQDHKSRLLRININHGKPQSMDVLAEGFILANGLVWKGNRLYLTDSLIQLKKSKNGKLLSGVYSFNINEFNKGKSIAIKAFKEGNTKDSHLLLTFKSSGKVGFGADGITVDNKNHLFNTIIEDGLVYKSSLDANGKVLSTKLFAKSSKMKSADGIIWYKKTNTLYVVDILRNAIRSVDANGKVSTVVENGNANGQTGKLDQPADIAVLGNSLIISNMDMPWDDSTGLLKNTTINLPATLTKIRLK